MYIETRPMALMSYELFLEESKLMMSTCKTYTIGLFVQSIGLFSCNISLFCRDDSEFEDAKDVHYGSLCPEYWSPIM